MINEDQLAKLIKETFFDADLKGTTIATGKGGVREYVKEVDKVFGGNGTLTFRKILTVFRNGWVVKEGNWYIIKG